MGLGICRLVDRLNKMTKHVRCGQGFADGYGCALMAAARSRHLQPSGRRPLSDAFLQGFGSVFFRVIWDVCRQAVHSCRDAGCIVYSHESRGRGHAMGQGHVMGWHAVAQADARAICVGEWTGCTDIRRVNCYWGEGLAMRVGVYETCVEWLSQNRNRCRVASRSGLHASATALRTSTPGGQVARRPLRARMDTRRSICHAGTCGVSWLRK